MVYCIGFRDIINDLLIFIWANLVYVLGFIRSDPNIFEFPHSFNIPLHPREKLFQELFKKQSLYMQANPDDGLWKVLKHMGQFS